MNRLMRYAISGIMFFLVGLIACNDLFAQFGGFGGGTRSSMGSSGRSNTTAGSRYTPGQTWQALIETDPETKSIIVVGDDDANQRIKEIIKSLDHPVPQVLIKVVFVEVTHNKDVDVGFEGSFKTKTNGSAESLKSAFGVASQTTGGFFHILEKDLDVTLRAMSEVGKLEVLSRPSILTRNSQLATITVGQKVPFIQNSRITQDGQTINTVTYNDIGIILQVTPFITSDGLVEMDVYPEISALTGDTVPISDTINAPVYALRSASTQVVVPDGVTVVIGGLMQDNNTESVKKIPVLGDIPLLGMAFRRTVTAKDKTELLIFLTPHVVQGNAQLADLSKREKESMEMVPQVFSGQQMKKYIDEPQNKDTIEQNPVFIPAPDSKTADQPRYQFGGKKEDSSSTDLPETKPAVEPVPKETQPESTDNSAPAMQQEIKVKENPIIKKSNKVIKKPLSSAKPASKSKTKTSKSSKENVKRMSPNKE